MKYPLIKFSCLLIFLSLIYIFVDKPILAKTFILPSEEIGLLNILGTIFKVIVVILFCIYNYKLIRHKIK